MSEQNHHHSSHAKPAPDGKTAPEGREAGTEKPEGQASTWTLLTDLEEMLNGFVEDFDINTNLSGKERLRLFGAGVRNFGFIEKAFDIARENPSFLPPQFPANILKITLEDFEESRQLFWILQQFLNAANELMLMRADECFRLALRIYGNLREMNRAKVPGADVLYNTLLTFFRRRPRTANEAEPTQKQLERDFMKLIHGHADGDIEIVNEQPRFTGGIRKVVDNVHTGRAEVKETAEGKLKE
jgi:hypothetical protein